MVKTFSQLLAEYRHRVSEYDALISEVEQKIDRIRQQGKENATLTCELRYLYKLRELAYQMTMDIKGLQVKERDKHDTTTNRPTKNADPSTD